MLDIGVGIMLGYLMEGLTGALILAMLNGAGFFMLLLSGLVLGTPVTLGLMLLGGSLTWAWAAVGALLSRRQGAQVLALWWLGFTVAFWAGHFLGGPRGVLGLTVPLVALFWFTFLRLAPLSLPTRNPCQQMQTVKSVLTFTLGRNYPYYYIQHGETEERVAGEVSRSWFAGPGIILSDPTSAVALWNGYRVRDVSPPGLTFTEFMEVIREVFDLRPQAHSATLRTRTRDGIEIQTGITVTCRLYAGNARAELGHAYPYRREAAFKATHARSVERQDASGTSPEEIKLSWDELVLLRAKQTLSDILMLYTFDDLCAPFDVERDPRTEIKARWRPALQEAVAPLGAQILGAGFGNLMPVDPAALNARVENWRVKWETKLLVELGDSEAKAMRELDRVRLEARYELLKHVSKRFEGLENTPEQLSANVIALRFVDLVEEMLGDQSVQRTLPSEVMETLRHIQETVARAATEEDKDEG